jgi:hypothetical protein
MSKIRHGLRSLARLGAHKLRGQSRRHDVIGRPPNQGQQHEGATERFGAELRAMRHMQVSPELISDIETELQWGLVWHEFERSMQAEIDRVFAPYLTIADCVDFNDLRDLVGLAEPVPA